MAFFDFLKSTDEQGNKKWDWANKINPLAIGILGSMTNPDEGVNALSSYSGVRSNIDEQSRRNEEARKQQEYQDYMKSLQEQKDAEEKRRWELDHPMMTVGQTEYSALNGSPLQGMFAPTMVSGGQNNVPDATLQYLKTMGVSPEEAQSSPMFSYNKSVPVSQYISALGMVPQEMTEEDKLKLKLLESQIHKNYQTDGGDNKPPESYTSLLLKNYKAENPKIDTGMVYPNQTPIMKNEPLQSYASRTGGGQGERQFLYEQSGNPEYQNPNRTIFGVQNKQDPQVDQYIKAANLGSIEATVRKAIKDRKSGDFINKLIQRAALSGYPTDPAVWQNAVLNNSRVSKKKTAKK